MKIPYGTGLVIAAVFYFVMFIATSSIEAIDDQEKAWYHIVFIWLPAVSLGWAAIWLVFHVMGYGARNSLAIDVTVGIFEFGLVLFIAYKTNFVISKVVNPSLTVPMWILGTAIFFVGWRLWLLIIWNRRK